MRLNNIFRLLLEQAIISPPQYELLEKHEKSQPISIHWEARVFLLAGISMLSSGLGILIYKNIDTIGHQAIIALIALATAACGWYAFQKRFPFTLGAVEKPHTIADNILLLGCSLFLILEGYLQYQYQIFGERYGIATLIPAALFFFVAYRFDHIGVLTMALTAFVSWAGISTTPINVLKDGIFDHERTLVLTGILVGSLFILVGQLLNFRLIKTHFTFSYVNFGLNLVCIAAIYGALQQDERVWFSLICLAFSAFALWYARREHSHFMLLASAIYGYISFTILISKIDFGLFWLYYGIFSCLGVVGFLMNYKKILSRPLRPQEGVTNNQ